LIEEKDVDSDKVNAYVYILLTQNT